MNLSIPVSLSLLLFPSLPISSSSLPISLRLSILSLTDTSRLPLFLLVAPCHSSYIPVSSTFPVYSCLSLSILVSLRLPTSLSLAFLVSCCLPSCLSSSPTVSSRHSLSLLISSFLFFSLPVFLPSFSSCLSLLLPVSLRLSLSHPVSSDLSLFLLIPLHNFLAITVSPRLFLYLLVSYCL